MKEQEVDDNEIKELIKKENIENSNKGKGGLNNLETVKKGKKKKKE